jgi:phosphoribosylformylglycinamidine synthase
MEKVREIRLAGLQEKELEQLSREMLLSLNAEEMKLIQAYFSRKGRDPKDAELETLAQTWSEHCKHKTFAAEIKYHDTETGRTEIIDGMFRTYIAGATEKIAKKKKWLVSVFTDNAGIIRFNDSYDLAFKAETHNHPSALEPYGGANTGVGGVIRDVLGAGLGAKPIANTDVFCFALPDYPHEKLPEGILHPKRIAKGVRAGVRDYGNRMGIPTVNGAILFDNRYLGNPLVYCGCLGLIPKGMHRKSASAGNLIVAIGGRTGKDGLHGATFSSIELEESSPVSAVQIGNPIEERKVMDAMLKARDEGLYNAVTDCGAGGFSSAIGEMAENLGAEVRLEKAPLKYSGLLPWEIWLSESQERMVLSVPEKNLERLKQICETEDVEATVLGRFTNDKVLKVLYDDEVVVELDSDFLHKGVPKRKLSAEWKAGSPPEPKLESSHTLPELIHKLLSMPNIASKETTVRQYDHEVQGGSVIKPFMGAEDDGPSDAAVIRPLLDCKEAVALANGINPVYSDIDPYHMAASAVDEAVRNLVCVGCTLDKVALLDNFSWGNPNKSSRLAGLVRAAKGCHDIAVAYETPFISGKDSLYNEYACEGNTITIPGTLLISSLGIMEDASKRVSMYAKKEGSLIYLTGKTYAESGGSHYYRLYGLIGQDVPEVRPAEALKDYKALSLIASRQKGSDRIILSMHDLSEGGLAVALAEMAFAGMKGITADISKVLMANGAAGTHTALFSESNSRILVEVAEEKKAEFEEAMKGASFSLIGKVTNGESLVIKEKDRVLADESLSRLKKSWKKTLDW